MTEPGWLNSPPARLCSLLQALALSIIILVYPHALITAEGSSQHSLLMLLLISVSIGFIHGVGFSPQRFAWRLLLGPLSSWPLMLFGFFYMLNN